MDYSIPYTDSEIALYSVLKSKNTLKKYDINSFVSNTYYHQTKSMELKATMVSG
ncbi:MAG: hypothetical protein R2771_06030 [Saprospiraceae bacterium]